MLEDSRLSWYMLFVSPSQFAQHFSCILVVDSNGCYPGAEAILVDSNP